MTVEARELVVGALRTARWSAHLPAGEGREAFRLWLSHRLAGHGRDEVRRALEDLSALLERDTTPAEPHGRPEPPVGDLEPLVAFGREYLGDDWKPSSSPAEDVRQALEALSDLAARLNDLAPGSSGRGRRSLRDVLGRAAVRLASTDSALRKAAQEAFERLLQSLSPAAVEAQAGGKGMKLGPFHKAGLYDAWSQKFSQLDAYHRAGRLVGDFRAAYQRYLQNEAQGKEGP